MSVDMGVLDGLGVVERLVDAGCNDLQDQVEAKLERRRKATTWAERELERGDAVGFMGVVGSGATRVEHLWRNACLLSERGMFEAVLTFTYTTGRASRRD